MPFLLNNMDSQNNRADRDCYQIFRDIRANGFAITSDGWKVEFEGLRAAPHSQRIIATNATEEISLTHCWGSEGIARLMLKARAK